MTYTVEKIGGTSMSDFDSVLDNILLRPVTNGDLYNRAIVVSAYGGFTDALLECEKTQNPGVYQLIAQSDDRWKSELDMIESRMLLTNDHMFADPFLRMPADTFIRSRIAEAKSCISNLLEVCQYGQFELEQYLPKIREFLASIGEAHSAYNTATKLKSVGINAKFIDLSMWESDEMPETLDDCIRTAFESIDLNNELPIVTGYAASREGIVSYCDRGYSEETFSRLACVTGADLAIIHRDNGLSTAEPQSTESPSTELNLVRLYREDHADVVDQFEKLGIELQIKNLYEAGHTEALYY